MTPHQKTLREGFLYGLGAYGIWGLVPLYFHSVSSIPALELLAHRTVWSFLLLVGLLTLLKRWPDIRRTLQDRRTCAMLLVSAFLLATNWYGYIMSVFTGRVMEASLGYFMLPFANVAFGMLFFKEKLRPLQGVALVIAGFGIARMTWAYGTMPWLAIYLTISFGLYGVMRKMTPVDGLLGFALETFFLLPCAAAYLIYLLVAGEMKFMHPHTQVDWLVLFGAVVTTTPLVCFAQAVRRIGLISIGFIQYLSPVMQMLIAVYILGEEFSESRQVSFIFVWLGLIVFTVDTVRLMREKKPDTTSVEALEVD